MLERARSQYGLGLALGHALRAGSNVINIDVRALSAAGAPASRAPPRTPRCPRIAAPGPLPPAGCRKGSPRKTSSNHLPQGEDVDVDTGAIEDVGRAARLWEAIGRHHALAHLDHLGAVQRIGPVMDDAGREPISRVGEE